MALDSGPCSRVYAEPHDHLLHTPQPAAPIACDMSTAADTPEERIGDVHAAVRAGAPQRERRDDSVVFTFRAGGDPSRSRISRVAKQPAARSSTTASRPPPTRWSSRSAAASARAWTWCWTRSTRCPADRSLPLMIESARVITGSRVLIRVLVVQDRRAHVPGILVLQRVEPVDDRLGAHLVVVGPRRYLVASDGRHLAAPTRGCRRTGGREATASRRAWRGSSLAGVTNSVPGPCRFQACRVDLACR